MRWTSTLDKKPESTGRYLCVVESIKFDSTVKIVYFNMSNKFEVDDWSGGEYVSYWMNIPELPTLADDLLSIWGVL